MERRVIRILILAFILLLLAAILAWQAFSHWPQAQALKPTFIKLEASSFARGDKTEAPDSADINRSTWPAPETFAHVSGALLARGWTVRGNCHEKYYTVVVYPASTDYRQDATRFIYNQAHPCVNQEFEHLITVDTIATSSDQYYVVRADQKDEGTWFNPY